MLTVAVVGAGVGGCFGPWGSDEDQGLGPFGPPVTFSVGTVSLEVNPAVSFTDGGGTLAVATDADGSVRMNIASSSVTYVPMGTLSGPEGVELEVLADGSLVVRDSDGRLVAGITPIRARFSGSAPVTVSASDGGVLWLADTAVTNLSWGNREGGKSLAVTPSAWGRSGSDAAGKLVWAVVSAEPGADSDSMYDQLDCHRVWASEKATWNLEPWRPKVDPLVMYYRKCNPT